jgi:hypothetical protein
LCQQRCRWVTPLAAVICQESVLLLSRKGGCWPVAADYAIMAAGGLCSAGNSWPLPGCLTVRCEMIAFCL